MSMEKRKWWRNCFGYRDEKWPEDAEVDAIDKLEDKLGKLDDDTVEIRNLIGRIELCHHKAERHVELIIRAIGEGKTLKKPGSRPVGEIHPREALTELVIGSLTAWVNEEHFDVPPFGIGGISVEDLFNFIGESTPLKVWQVRQVCAKLRSFLDPEFRYYEMVDYPDRYEEKAHYRGATINTVITDKVGGEVVKLTLASAIDHLQPCNWNFPSNLIVVLRAIGGDLNPENPFASHARNLALSPAYPRFKYVVDDLKAYLVGERLTSTIYTILGSKTPVKEWLVASLEKTLRLQLGI
ncbi:hypothetical protein GF359_10415 [candidate division WOR-3 bacterium]|uniref:Uncharacterized protein n=1 Tax=candidate division WOR-3 bacterium TaxID=2052148 RepID=A0A9D5KCD8_UNCW3|nr:hypothetical protein [candidate division WOR-3 bacterium]MBD3365614.1 hypothetical protein [candidate division WOR-3 bacterium]